VAARRIRRSTAGRRPGPRTPGCAWRHKGGNPSRNDGCCCSTGSNASDHQGARPLCVAHRTGNKLPTAGASSSHKSGRRDLQLPCSPRCHMCGKSVPDVPVFDIQHTGVCHLSLASGTAVFRIAGTLALRALPHIRGRGRGVAPGVAELRRSACGIDRTSGAARRSPRARVEGLVAGLICCCSTARGRRR
jgi:hypothetical protein